MVDLEDVVVSVKDEVLYDDIEFLGVGQGKAGFPEQFLSLVINAKIRVSQQRGKRS